MNTIISWLKVGCSFLFGILGYFLGGFDPMLTTLLIFMGIDYLTGVLSATVYKKLNSRTGAKGIVKKIFMLILIGLANWVSVSTGVEGIRLLAISFYIANEGISIIENASKIGVPIPKKLKEVLEQLHKEGE